MIAAGDLFLVKLASGEVRSRNYDVMRGTTTVNFSNKVVCFPQFDLAPLMQMIISEIS